MPTSMMTTGRAPRNSPGRRGSAWTAAMHTAVEHGVESAWHHGYEVGYLAALRDVAARHIELGQAWQRIGRRTHDQHVADRLALFERCAAQLRERIGWAEWDDAVTATLGHAANEALSARTTEPIEVTS